MTLEEYTKEKILEDVKGLQYLFELKEVIRSHQSRDEKDTTESVAEHVYGMHVLSQYFLPLENPDNSWDRSLVSELINTHDIDEIETGDIIGWMKTPEDKVREEEAKETILNKVPTSMRDRLSTLLNTYNEQTLPEATFVKAIDKLEPHIHFFREKRKSVFKLTKCTSEKAMSIKEPYMVGFPYIQKCNKIIHDELLAGGYYWQEGQ
jgi:putative hydrolases of HD superfamily